MWSLVMYSNYFEIVFTLTFLDSWTGFISDIFMFKTVILYHYTFVHYKYSNDHTRYNICSNICSAWLLDIVISMQSFLLYSPGFESLLSILCAPQADSWLTTFLCSDILMFCDDRCILQVCYIKTHGSKSTLPY